MYTQALMPEGDSNPLQIPKSLVLGPSLGMDGPGGQHCPQPQDPSATPGETTCWNTRTLSLQLLTEQKL